MKYFRSWFRVEPRKALIHIKNKLNKAKKPEDLDKGEIKDICNCLLEDNFAKATENYDVAKLKKDFDEDLLDEIKAQTNEVIIDGLEELIKIKNKIMSEDTAKRENSHLRILPERNPFCRFWDTFYYQLLSNRQYFEEYHQSKDEFLENALRDLKSIFSEELNFLESFERDSIRFLSRESKFKEVVQKIWTEDSWIYK